MSRIPDAPPPPSLVCSIHLRMRVLSSSFNASKPSMSSSVEMTFELLHMRSKLLKMHSTWYQWVRMACPDLRVTKHGDFNPCPLASDADSLERGRNLAESERAVWNGLLASGKATLGTIIDGVVGLHGYRFCEIERVSRYLRRICCSPACQRGDLQDVRGLLV